ncbi:hypothetical protein MKW92_037841 [Papaver armeniacum]|nr:hypothetical protein MKW92_037841 [Papaver armeniacum]
MGSSSKRQQVSNFATARMAVALILCLLLLDGFSYSIEATGRIIDDQDCTTFCKSRKYFGGKCYPNDWDEKPLGLCCCLN